tara:strand:- start:3940 stop:4515 length:576 start_codon:yes stop_codon:yes gene_type:complete
MIISITINGVLRDILSKFEEVYEKYYDTKVLSSVVTPNLLEYVDFKDEEELIDFLYNDATMEIFGQAREVENNVISYLIDLYKEMPSNYKLRIVSDELGKSKPATLWFLAKYGVVCDEIIFYHKNNIKDIWETTDIFITTDTKIIETKPKNKKLIIIDKCYNSDMVSDLRINSIKKITSFENAFEETIAIE